MKWLPGSLMLGLWVSGTGPALGETAIADVQIAPGLPSVEVLHQGESVTIRREQDQGHTVAEEFALTSRPCPPFCIQPAVIAPGVETIGELEVLGYLERMAAGDDTILLIDSRTPDWVARGTIPGAINIPWDRLNISRSDPFTITDLLTGFGAREQEGLWDFREARTLVLFCNGMWCAQSPANIRALISLGYPAHRLKWYRGGMQNWQGLGLTTVGETRAGD